MTIMINEVSLSGGTIFEIRGTDDRTGVWCLGGGMAQMTGIGVLQRANMLVVKSVWLCLPPGEGWYPALGSEPAYIEFTYIYNPAEDVLQDDWGNIMSRVP